MKSVDSRFNKEIVSQLPLVVLLGGVLLTVYGLTQLSWPRALPWFKLGFVQYISFIFFCAVLVVAGAYRGKVNSFAVGLIIAIALTVVAGAVWPLIVLCWVCLASVVLGRAVSNAIGLPIESVNSLMHMLVGVGAYGTLVGLVAHFPLSYPGVFGVVLTLPLLCWRGSVVDIFKNMASLAQKNLSGDIRINWLASAVVVVALIHYVVALMPELGHDALAMHLFIPAHLASRHQWGFDAETYVWAVMPMLGDWIFSLAYVLAGETSARLINVSFIFILAWLVRDLVMWAGGTSYGAKWAVLIFLSTPLVFTESSSLFIESVWAVYIVASTFFLLKLYYPSNNVRPLLILSSILIAFAMAAKSVTLAIIPVFFFVMIFNIKYLLKEINALTWVKAAFLIIVIGFIPYFTAWQFTGNPIFPFYNAIFKSPYYPEVNFESASVFGRGVTWDILYKITFNSGKFLEATEGASGFQWLLLFLPISIMLIAKREPKGAGLILCGIGLVIAVFQSVSYLRYVFPAWAILASVIGLGLGALHSNGGRANKIIWCISASSVVILNLLFLSSGAPFRDFPLISITNGNNRDAYLLARIPLRSAVEAVNKINLGKSPVAVFAHPMAAGINSDVLYSNWYNFKFQSDVNEANSEEAMGDLLIRRGVDFVILDSNWSGGAEKRALITSATDMIVEYGTISVRKVKSNFRYKTELLRNSNFTYIDGWSLSAGSTYDSNTHAITVSVNASATQSVTVLPGNKYLNSVVARCDEIASLGRVQINWLDKDGNFIRPDIKTFECTPDWSEHSMEVVSPPSASVAVVYTSSHTTTPIKFKKNSLTK